jgi:hypothetical protein
VKKYDVLQYLIRTGPGRNELELARAIHGEKAYQQSVNTHCLMLVIEGKAERRGAGGVGTRHARRPLNGNSPARAPLLRGYAGSRFREGCVIGYFDNSRRSFDARAPHSRTNRLMHNARATTAFGP